MIRRSGEPVSSRVPVAFEQALVMKSGFPVTVVVTVRSHGSYIEDGFVVFWHGASDEMLSKLEVVLEVIVRLCVRVASSV